MADMQAGIGPFLGVFLLAHGWQSGLIGTVMTVGGVAGMLMTTPAGALIDATRHKKLYVIIPGICTVIASGIVLLSQSFWLVTLSQVATAIAGAAIGPAVAGITLGIVRQAGFNRQNGHNQAFNHAGNMVGAGLSGLLGWMFGFHGRVVAGRRVRRAVDRLGADDPECARSTTTRRAGSTGARTTTARSAASPCCSNASRC